MLHTGVCNEGCPHQNRLPSMGKILSILLGSVTSEKENAQGKENLKLHRKFRMFCKNTAMWKFQLPSGSNFSKKETFPSEIYSYLWKKYWHQKNWNKIMLTLAKSFHFKSDGFVNLTISQKSPTLSSVKFKMELTEISKEQQVSRGEECRQIKKLIVWVSGQNLAKICDTGSES